MTGRAAGFPLIALLAGCATIDQSPVATKAYPPIFECAAVASLAAENGCAATAGTGPNTLIVGTVLAEDAVFRNGSVLIGADGRIIDAGCDVDAAGATIIACPGGIVSPGFINPHDHIWYNHRPPAALDEERYGHRHHWRLGLEGHSQPDFERAEGDDQVAWAELRHALAGTTSIAGMGGVPGLLRNLEDAELDGDIGLPPAYTTVFPLGDATGEMLQDGCGYPDVVDPWVYAAANSFQAHVAEGVDLSAANEIGCLTGRAEGATNVTGKPSAFVHFVGASTEDAIFIRDHDVSVIWSPRSNIALYGHTANVSLLDRLGVNIALSTDWLPSGSMNLLRELRCAADFSDNYLDSYFSDYELWKMVTVNAARSFSLHDEIGSIAAGRLADIVIFRAGTGADPYHDVVNAFDADMLLVLRSGRPLAGNADLVTALADKTQSCKELPTKLACGGNVAVCFDGADGRTMRSVLAANVGSYALMSCGAVPSGEPRCSPSWPGEFDGMLRIGSDDDGDGVANDVDNCRKVFNPIRPMDLGEQPDWDRDAAGDACDDNPLE